MSVIVSVEVARYWQYMTLTLRAVCLFLDKKLFCNVEWTLLVRFRGAALVGENTSSEQLTPKYGCH